MTLRGELAGPMADERLALPRTRDLYWFSMRLGLGSLGRGPRRAALARVLNPLAYPRGMEFALTLRGLSLPQAGRVLDIASPKLLFLWLASHTSTIIHTTDITTDFVAPVEHFVGRLGLSGDLQNRLYLEQQDARALTYEDASFDAVYSISVVEHIPGHGDSAALREMGRVLRPGGRACLTVPFHHRDYGETWVAGDVFERRRSRNGERLFYERRYNPDELRRRLVEPSGLRLESFTCFGEPYVPFDRLWRRLPLLAHLPLGWAQPLFEAALLRPLEQGRVDRAIGVALTLVKD